jgi:hypothetical protein
MKTIQDVRDDFARAIADLTPKGYSPKVALLDSGAGKRGRMLLHGIGIHVPGRFLSLL